MADKIMRLVIVGSNSDAIAKLVETGAAADEVAKKVDQAGLSSRGFGDAMNDATNKAKSGLSPLLSSLNNFGINTGPVDKFSSSLLGADTSGEKLLGTVGKIGGAALAGGLLAFGVAAEQGIKKASEFSASMEMIHTQAGASQAEVTKMSAAILGIGADTTSGPMALSDALYHTESMGMRGAQALAAVKGAAELAQVGQANLTDTTNALDEALANNISGAQNMNQALGTLNATVGAGDMHMQDLADAMTSSVPVAKTYGLTLTDVGAALATFGDLGLRGADAGTRLRQVIITMGAPSKAAAEALNAIGMSSLELATDMRQHGLAFALEDLKTHLIDSGATAEQQGEILARAFGGGKTSTGVLMLLENLDRLKAKYVDIGAGQHQFASDFQASQGQIANQMKELGNEVDVLEIRLGNFLIPKLQELGVWVEHNKGTVIDLAEAIGGALGVAVTVFVGTKIYQFEQGVQKAIVAVYKWLTASQANADGQTAADAEVEASNATVAASSRTAADQIVASQASVSEATATTAEVVTTDSAEIESAWERICSVIAVNAPTADTAVEGLATSFGAVGAAATEAADAVGVDMAAAANAVVEADTAIEEANTAATASFAAMIPEISLVAAALLQLPNTIHQDQSKSSGWSLFGMQLPWWTSANQIANHVFGSGGSGSGAAPSVTGSPAGTVYGNVFGGTGPQSANAAQQELAGATPTFTPILPPGLNPNTAAFLAAQSGNVGGLGTPQMNALSMQGNSLLQMFQGAAATGTPVALERSLTTAMQQKMQLLVSELVATHQGALVSLASQLVAAYQANQAELTQVLATNEKVALADQTQMMATELQGMTAILTQIATNATQLVTDETQMTADQSSARQQAISDQAKIVTDTLAERGLFGLNLVAQQMQVGLDTFTAHADALINADKLKVDAITLTSNTAIGVAQKHLAQVTATENALVQQAQAGVDQAATGTQQQQAYAAAVLKQAQANAAYAEAQASAAVAAIQNQAKQQIAQAKLVLQQEQGQSAYTEAQQQAAIAIEREKAQTQYAGSGLTVNITGLPTNDSAAIAQAVSWEMRQHIAVA